MSETGLHLALLAVQSKLNAPKGQFNSFGKYHYRSCEDILEAVKPLLAQNGLTLTLSDDIISVGNRVYVKATATVHGSDGAETACTAYAREPDGKKGMDDSQVTGTASSYARKYALNGLFCIDDAKDADTDENARQTGRAAANKATVNPPVCTECQGVVQPYGKMTAQEMAKYTKGKYGRVLCADCAKDEAVRVSTSEGSPA